MASQSQALSGLSSLTLKHLAEEARHAHFFKRHAQTVAGRDLAYRPAEMICGSHARLYMGRLDVQVARHNSGEAAYLFMSMIVEIRATWFYQIYGEELKQRGSSIKLTSLLAEETRHLDEIVARLTALNHGWAKRLPALELQESALFSALLSAMENSVGAQKPARKIS